MAGRSAVIPNALDVAAAVPASPNGGPPTRFQGEHLSLYDRLMAP